MTDQSRKRELDRERSKRRRDREALFGRGGYDVLPLAIELDRLAERFPPIRHARDDRDQLIKQLEWLIHDLASGDGVNGWEKDYG